jgi:uncharacterized protein (DUF58 family)
MAAYEEYGLSPEIFRNVRRIEMVALRLVTHLLAGEYSSVFKGQGIEFAEVRPYEPGDDIRSIDWNVTARMGQTYIKRFVEERESVLMLLVDASGSLQVGSQQLKSMLSAEVAAVLALAAIQNNDRVGLILFTDRVENSCRPAKDGGMSCASCGRFYPISRFNAARISPLRSTFSPVSRGVEVPHFS